MIYHYDLHIHSVLSPCADVLMTPNNIFNMAHIKGLNLISITDHNAMKQLEICEEISKSYDLLFIPGVELSVQEGFHVLCYFKTVDDAMKFDKWIESYISKERFDPAFYGDQELTDIHDQVINHYPYLLSSPLQIGLSDVIEGLKNYEHLLFYAHINKDKFSGLSHIQNYPLDGLELTHSYDQDFITKHQLSKRHILYNSDAHQIVDILEKTKHNQIKLERLTVDDFFRYFKHG